MTRQPLPEFDEENPRISIAPLKKRGEGDVVDQYESIPGSLKIVGPQPTSLKEKKSRDHAEFLAYAQNLVTFGGDPVKAIAQLYGMDEEEVSKNLLVLRDELHRKGEGYSFSTTLRKHDVEIENQVAVLRHWMYSKNPAAALGSIKLLQDASGKAGQRREGQKVEDLIRASLAMKEDEAPE